jgi:hypothetical protein
VVIINELHYAAQVTVNECGWLGIRFYPSSRGSSDKETLYSTRSCVNWALYGTRGPLKRSHSSPVIMLLSH